MSAFTATQEQELQRAYDILTEHFDCLLVVVCHQVVNGDDRNDATKVSYKGGAMAARGLAIEAIHRTLPDAYKIP